MAFKMDITEVYAAESRLHYGNTVEYATRDWKIYPLPYPNGMTYPSNAALNMSMIKQMLTQMDLKNGQDYIFCRQDVSTTPANIHVKFKNSEEGLMAIMRWISSNWYRNL